MAWFGPARKNQPGWPELDWRNMSQGSWHYLTTASGVTIATLSDVACVLKAIWSDDFLNGAAVVRSGAATLHAFGSAHDFTSWTPGWSETNAALTIQTATAQLFGFLVGTKNPQLKWDA